ncbi:MAG: cell division protein FtsZ [Rhizobiales bacterium]|nr:cell division protein FtsZ [Hyphomicrobiales bacterium]
MTINLTVPNLAELKPRITVFGVGGAGGNAVTNMIESGLEGVEFVVANTDAQALAQSAAERRIQMGTALTQGLGAGSQPQVGAGAAEEALPEIMDQIAGAHMVFITAGMGGGTGTGAAPVIARASKEQGILTVGVVTKPFHFEGQRRQATADRGIEQLAKFVDTLIVIPNQNLFRVANEKTTFAAAFAMADQVLYSGVASITELMTKDGLINLDFADVRAIMSEMGKAMMGTGEASGEKRAVEAAEAAISNPLLDDVSMRGARGLLISISGGPDLTLYEVDEAATRIREEVDPEANIILGATFDETLDGTMRVSVVATGLSLEEQEGFIDEADEDGEAESSVYGYAGTGPITPAPMAERHAPAAPAEAHETPVEEHMEEPVAKTEDEMPVAEEMPVVSETQPAAAQEPEELPEEMPAAPAAPRVHTASNVPKMPEPEDFPPIAQKQIAEHNDPAPVSKEPVQKKQRRSLLERLASVGLGGKRDEPEVRQTAENEPRIIAQRPVEEVAEAAPPAEPAGEQMAAEDAAVDPDNVHQLSPQIDPELDDDDLEIPAFLRRQAN